MTSIASMFPGWHRNAAKSFQDQFGLPTAGQGSLRRSARHRTVGKSAWIQKPFIPAAGGVLDLSLSGACRWLLPIWRGLRSSAAEPSWQSHLLAKHRRVLQGAGPHSDTPAHQDTPASRGGHVPTPRTAHLRCGRHNFEHARHTSKSSDLASITLSERWMWISNDAARWFV